jgi:molecular chaperone IbpA
MTRTLTTLDLPNFYKATIGFDRMFNQFQQTIDTNASGGYPPYNVVEIAEDEFMISVAVAGFGMDDLDITKEKNVLKVIGNSPATEEEVKYLHKGIGSRNFRREFTLAEHVNIVTAELRLGMLNIHLKLEVPEEEKPQKISIINNDK